jgi:hypothetical protein
MAIQTTSYCNEIHKWLKEVWKYAPGDVMFGYVTFFEYVCFQLVTCSRRVNMVMCGKQKSAPSSNVSQMLVCETQ